MPCLPIKSPWLNPIEPRWVHGKRRVVEPIRLLAAAESNILTSARLTQSLERIKFAVLERSGGISIIPIRGDGS